MGKKVMVSFLAALMIASSFSTTAFAALGKTDTVAKTQQEQQESKEKVVKKKLHPAKQPQMKKRPTGKKKMLDSGKCRAQKSRTFRAELDEKMCEAAQVRAEECLESYCSYPSKRKRTDHCIG